jgi:hypothetical protein
MHLVFALVLMMSSVPHLSSGLPDHLTISGVQWKIEKTDWDPRGVAGLTNYRLHTIYISRRQSLAEEQDTLLHELLHCVMGHAFSEEKIPGHEVISSLTPKLLQLFKENPELVKYLQQNRDGAFPEKQSAD